MSNAVTTHVRNAARNAAPDPTHTRPDPKTLTVTAGGQAQTATRETDPLPRVFAPQWFRPFAPPVHRTISTWRICGDCQVTWYGDDGCFVCGTPGNLRFWPGMGGPRP